MDDAFVFYAYWNGNQIRDLFEGLVSVTAGSGFVQLAAFLVVTGLVAALLIGAVRGEGKHVISYFACAVLFWFVAIVPKATVVIEDVRSHTVYNVDNVPLSMAFFASVSSRIGHWLTQAYETAFIPADVAKYSSFGAVYPQRVMEVLQRTGPVTVQGRETLQSVLKSCVLPEVVLDSRKADQAMASSDLWTMIKSDGWVNPARLAVMPDGSVVKCPQAVAELEQVLTTVELPALKRWVGVKLDPEIKIYTEMNNYMTDVAIVGASNFDFAGAFRNEIYGFIDAVLGRAPVIAPAEDGVALMRILDAVYRSAQTGKEERV